MQTTMTNPYWKTAEPGIEYRNKNVHVNRRMTQYEVRRFKHKADKLLEQAQKHDYSVERLVAYGNAFRIGAFMSPKHDPLGNGIVVSRFEEFSVDAVKPHAQVDTVMIRFLYDGEIDV